MLVLYITYNGLTEPLGQRQVLPYLVGLAGRGWDYRVISFEKEETADPGTVSLVRERLDARRISWHPHRYHRRPTFPATAYDSLRGLISGLGNGRKVDLIHARSTVPAAIARCLAVACRKPWIFDVRGLVAQEYADAGHWPPEGWLFKVTNRVERSLLGVADGLVFLTDRIRRELLQQQNLSAEGRAIAVIPCAVDTTVFSPQERARREVRTELGLGGEPLLVYSGSLGSWYRFQDMLDFVGIAGQQIPGLRFLVLTMQPEIARKAVSSRRLTQVVAVRSVEAEQVPRYLAAADAGICFLGESVSKTASSPTKYGEYLAAGLPVLTNPWVGDAAILAGEDVWTLVDAFDEMAYRRAASHLKALLATPGRTRAAARALAERRFGLEDALDRYEALYRQVIGRATG